MITGREKIGGVARYGEQNHQQPQKKKNFLPACVEEVTTYLKSEKKQILAIIHCRREGGPELFSQLLVNGVLIISAKKRLQSKSKQNDPDQITVYLKLYQSGDLR